MKITKILLNPGHGNDTPVKRSPIWSDGSQLFEYEFNRDICERIHAELTELGIESVILVTEEHDIPLKERARRANQYHAKSTLLLDIHANAGGGTGFEVYTTRGVTRSDPYATILFDSIKACHPDLKARTDYADGDPDKEAGFYVISKSSCSAVLIEAPFMDYEPDCRLLMDPEFRKSWAMSIVDGIKVIVTL